MGNNGVLKMGTALVNSNSVSDRLLQSGPRAVASSHTPLQIIISAAWAHRPSAKASRSFPHRMARPAPAPAPARRGTALTLNGDQLDVGAFQYPLFAADANGQAGSWSLSPQAPPRRRPACQRHRLHLGTAPKNRSMRCCRPSCARAIRRWSETCIPACATSEAWLRQRLGRRQPACLGPRDWRHHRQPGRRDAGRKPHPQGIFQAGVHLFANPPWNDGACAGVMRGDANVNGAHDPGGLIGYAGTLHTGNTCAGCYATYANPQGPYADFVQYGYHDVAAGSLGQGCVFGAASLMVSAEVDQRFTLIGGKAIEPQAQLIYHRLSLDSAASAASAASASISWGECAAGRRPRRDRTHRRALRGRSVDFDGTLAALPRRQLVARLVGARTTTFAGPPSATPIESAIGYTSTELKVGFTLGLTPSVSVYGQLGKVFHACSCDARVESAAQDTLGVNVMF